MNVLVQNVVLSVLFVVKIGEREDPKAGDSNYEANDVIKKNLETFTLFYLCLLLIVSDILHL